jgi:hypothetical protein
VLWHRAGTRRYVTATGGKATGGLSPPIGRMAPSAHQKQVERMRTANGATTTCSPSSGSVLSSASHRFSDSSSPCPSSPRMYSSNIGSSTSNARLHTRNTQPQGQLHGMCGGLRLCRFHCLCPCQLLLHVCVEGSSRFHSMCGGLLVGGGAQGVLTWSVVVASGTHTREGWRGHVRFIFCWLFSLPCTHAH